MKNECKFLKAGGLLLSMLMCAFCIAPVSASADSESDAEELDCSLTLDCQHEEKPIAGEEFKIYLVADIDENNDLTYTSDFADSGIMIETDSASELSDCAVTLETYIVEQENLDNEITPIAEGITDIEGLLSFEELETGMYLITGEELTEDNVTYTPIASLIPLPYPDEDNDHVDYDPTIMPKIEVSMFDDSTPISQKISVEKVWEDDEYEYQRPDEVSVVLFRDGEEYDRVVLNEENSWQYTWVNLDDESRWQLIEENVPDGYTMTSVLDSGKFTVTNTYNPPDTPDETTEPTEPNEPTEPDKSTETTETTEPTAQVITEETTVTGVSGTTNVSYSTITTSAAVTTVTTNAPITPASIKSSGSSSGTTLPQTGQLKWPIPILSASGLVMLTIGCILRRRYSDSNEK